jgi:uncharacterized protein
MTDASLRPASQGLLPVAPGERVELLDALRGFALLGILVINLGGFIGYWELTAEQRLALPSALTDGAAQFLTYALAQEKFYSLFSLLFGIGFAVQVLRAEQRGIDFAPLYRRRLGVLAAIGAVHLVLIWWGDILLLYAMVGFLLISLRRLPDRTLLFVALALIAVPLLQHVMAVLSSGLLNPGAPFLALSDRIEAIFLDPEVATPYLSLVVQGGWTDFFNWNATGPVWRLGMVLQDGRAFKVLAMFLFGFVIVRRGVLLDLEGYRPLFKSVLLIGGCVGLIANLGLAYIRVDLAPEFLSWSAVAQSALYTIGVAPLALAYAAGFALLWMSPTRRVWLTVMAPAGRMALTNYLAQTVIAIGLFYGVGMGWGGKMGPTLVVPLALLIFGIQVLVSTLWLRRFRYGPMEWLWRSLTYGQWQTMRLRSATGPPIPRIAPPPVGTLP